MIEKRTVFILGAGASCPYGFPTAEALRGDIIRDLQQRYASLVGAYSDRGREWVRAGYPEMSVVEKFLEAFGASSTKSVDLFLSRNPRFCEIGKLAIFLNILWCEKKSPLRKEELRKPDFDWYFYLYDSMTAHSNTSCLRAFYTHLRGQMHRR